MQDKPEEAKNRKISKKVEELVEEITKLSVLELSELVNTLQEKLGVSASVPQASVSPATTPATETPAEGTSTTGGETTQTVVMTNAGANKIAVIKALREINQNLGLKEAKDATDNVPFEVLKDAKVEDAKLAAEKLKAAGATIEIK